MREKIINGGIARYALLLCLLLPATGGAAEKPYIIAFKSRPGVAEKNLVHGAGGKVKRQFALIKALAANLPEQALARLRSNPNVSFVEEDIPLILTEPVVGGEEYQNSWGVARIGAFLAHEKGNFGAAVKIAVLDTGIDYTHPELALNYRGGDNFVSLDPTFHDPYDDSFNSHGTHVAGIIAAERNGTGVVGVAPQAELYAVKVLDGGGFGSASTLIAGLEWAVANDMDIANISIGSNQNSLALEEACRMAYEAGVLLVAAAGNTAGGEVLYPARYPSVIAVAGTAADDLVYWNSSLGPEVEFSAPALMINSTVKGGGYGLLSGTSQAAPHVSGVAALLMAEGVADLNNDGIVDQVDVRQTLQVTAFDLGLPGRDPLFGYGLVLASGEVSPPAIELTLTREKGPVLTSSERIVLEQGIFELRISNDSLRTLAIEVFEDGCYLPDLSQIITFDKKTAAELSQVIDASGRSLELVLIPGGRPGATATVSARPAP